MPRPKKPKKLLVLKGTARKHRMEARENELELTAGPMGDPPDWMPEVGVREWHRLCSDPEYSQVLAPAMRSTLESYCLLYARFVADAKGEGGLTASEGRRLHSLTMQLGLTPASQSKVSAPAKQKPESPWARVRREGVRNEAE